DHRLLHVLGKGFRGSRELRLVHAAVVRCAYGFHQPVAPRQSQSTSDDVAERGDARGGVETVGSVRELDLVAEACPEMHLFEQVFSVIPFKQYVRLRVMPSRPRFTHDSSIDLHRSAVAGSAY